MKKIYFVRHGVTHNNNTNLFQDENTELSEFGIGQAACLGARFASIDIEVIVSSSMRRAFQTAEAVSLVKNLPIQKNDLFVETMKPTFVRTKSKDDPEVKEIMKSVKKNFDNTEWRHSDEENFYDLLERSKKALEFIRSLDEEKILIVTHGLFLTFFVGFLVFGDDFNAIEFRKIEKAFVAKNTGITIMEILEDKNLLITWNDHAHLGELDIY